MGVTQAAGLSLRWFRDRFGAGTDDGRDPYERLSAEAATVPAGSEGAFWAPYLMGERTPHLDPFARAAFVGLSASPVNPPLTSQMLRDPCCSTSRTALGRTKCSARLASTSSFFQSYSNHRKSAASFGALEQTRQVSQQEPRSSPVPAIKQPVPSEWASRGPESSAPPWEHREWFLPPPIVLRSIPKDACTLSVTPSPTAGTSWV